jgi:hypothetical protein
MIPTSPAMPSDPTKAEWLAAPLALGVEVPEEPCVVVVADPPEAAAAPVEEAPEAPVEALAAPEPLTETAAVRQLVSVPGRTVNKDEKARAPLLSLRAMLKFVLA